MPQVWRLPDRGSRHRRSVGAVLRDLLARLGTRRATGHLVYFFPGTRDTLPPAFLAYVFAADVDLKVFDPLAVFTLGIVTLLLLVVVHWVAAVREMTRANGFCLIDT